MGVKVLVCGSRDWPADRAWEVGHALDVLGRRGRDVHVIHGAARGVDSYAQTYAQKLGFSEQAFPADWRGKGKRAGFLRNLEMLEQKPDLVLAFQRNKSRGTQHTIDEARRRGIHVVVYE